MRYAIDYDEHKDCFIYQKLKSSKSSEHFKTRRLAKKYVSKLNKQAELLRNAVSHIELSYENHFDATILNYEEEVIIEGQLDIGVSQE